MLNYDAVKNWDFGEIVQTYSIRDSMLYALGVGMGADPLDRDQLRFVYEKDLQTVPTICTVLGSPGFWWRDERTGADWVKLVHGEQAIRLFKPLPSSGTVIARNRVCRSRTKARAKAPSRSSSAKSAIRRAGSCSRKSCTAHSCEATADTARALETAIRPHRPWQLRPTAPRSSKLNFRPSRGKH